MVAAPSRRRWTRPPPPRRGAGVAVRAPAAELRRRIARGRPRWPSSTPRRHVENGELSREDDQEAARRHDAAGRRRASRPGGARRRWSPRSKRAMDTAAAAAPRPGWRPFQRLNRAEYAAAVRDLLGLDVDVSAYLPADTISAGFDNVADVQNFSPQLMQGYLRAASQISRLAVGDRQASATSATFKIEHSRSQMAHAPGTPIGTRGGLSVVARLPRRRRLRAQGVDGLRRARRPVRPHAAAGDGLQGAGRRLGGRRARGAARRQPGDDRDRLRPEQGPERDGAAHARRSTSPPGRTASRPRSSSGSTARSTTCWRRSRTPPRAATATARRRCRTCAT